VKDRSIVIAAAIFCLVVHSLIFLDLSSSNNIRVSLKTSLNKTGKAIRLAMRRHKPKPKVKKKVVKKKSIKPKIKQQVVKTPIEDKLEQEEQKEQVTQSFEQLILKQTQPRYPRLARRRKMQGTVRLKIGVLSTGQVDSVQIVQSSRYSLLDDAAASEAKNWVFKKHSSSGIYYVFQNIIFELK
jgi:protein TonB